MFNLNENNRFVMAQHPSDMRIGVNGMCGQVRAVGLDPTNGDVYIFVGSSRKIMKYWCPLKNRSWLEMSDLSDSRCAGHTDILFIGQKLRKRMK